MKIGIEVQRLFRERKFGIETSSLELIKKISQLDHNHEFVIFAKDDHDRACLAACDNIKIKTIGGKFFADFEQFFLPIAARNEQIDILHCTGNTAPYFCTIPIVQTLHDIIFMDAIPENDSYYQRFGNHYRRNVVPLITPRSKAVITVSQYEKKRIVSRLGIPDEKIHVVYNGIDEKRFYNDPGISQQQEVKAKYKLPDDYILFLGNPSFRKNSCRAIEAYVRYAAKTENPMALVTPGLSEKFVADKLRELNYPYDKYSFITPGYIQDSDLPAIYRCSKIFLFPSLSEGFGMPAVEAMACGTPVITSSLSSMPEIAGNAAILIDPLSALDISDAILALVSNDELREKKIHDGLLNAKRFNWASAAWKVLGLYESVAEYARSEREPAYARKQVYATRH